MTRPMSTKSDPTTCNDPSEPGLYLVGTPIGNLADISQRALAILARCDVLACEDTRVTRKLFQRHGLAVPPAIVACHDHNEAELAERLAVLAKSGKVVAVVSDAGMPGVSDPGFRLAQEAARTQTPITAIPGATALTMAVALCGLACPSFTFLGFPSRRDGKLRSSLEAEAHSRHALIWYESPHRVGRLLSMAAEVLGGGRGAALCMELTKKFERIERGTLAELAAVYAVKEARGEATLVVEGLPRRGSGCGFDEEE